MTAAQTADVLKRLLNIALLDAAAKVTINDDYVRELRAAVWRVAEWDHGLDEREIDQVWRPRVAEAERELAEARAEVAAARRELAAMERYLARENAKAGRDAAAAQAAMSGHELLNPHGPMVYVLWGDDEARPLYVGLSINVLSRLGSHMGDREKRPHVRRVAITRCKTYGAAEKLESRLIAHWRPHWNIRGVPPDEGAA